MSVDPPHTTWYGQSNCTMFYQLVYIPTKLLSCCCTINGSGATVPIQQQLYQIKSCNVLVKRVGGKCCNHELFINDKSTLHNQLHMFRSKERVIWCPSVVPQHCCGQIWESQGGVVGGCQVADGVCCKVGGVGAPMFLEWIESSACTVYIVHTAVVEQRMLLYDCAF